MMERFERSLRELQEFIGIAEYANYFSICWEPKELMECVGRLRDEHYPVNTERNYMFEVRFIEINGSVWAITSIPVNETANMDKIASELNLKIISGFPDSFTAADGFITDHDNVFILSGNK